MTTNNKIDLNTCVPGQKVKLRSGEIANYRKHRPDSSYHYQHWIGDRSYTDDGKYVIGASNHIYDVVEILPLEKESKPVTDLRTCVPGQKVKLRCDDIAQYIGPVNDDYRRPYTHKVDDSTYMNDGCYWMDRRQSELDIVEILPMEEELVKTSPETTQQITDQIDVSNPDHVSIIPQSNGVLISIKKGLTTISWRHYND